MSLNMRVIPNPGDGIVQAISDTIHKSTGFTKNCFDLFNICVTISVGLIFAHHLVGIGLGTVLAVIGVGRAIAAFNYLFYKKTKTPAGTLIRSEFFRFAFLTYPTAEVHQTL